MDHLDFEQTLDRLGEGIVIAVSSTADGGRNANFSETFGIANRNFLAPSVTMVHEPMLSRRAPVMESLLKGIEHEAGLG
jgi:hypothetical protein